MDMLYAKLSEGAELNPDEERGQPNTTAQLHHTAHHPSHTAHSVVCVFISHCAVVYNRG